MTMTPQQRAWRNEVRRRLGLPAIPDPASPTPAFVPFTPPAKTAAEREFDAVKSAALARHAAEKKAAADALATRQAAQAEEDRAVAMILAGRTL